VERCGADCSAAVCTSAEANYATHKYQGGACGVVYGCTSRRGLAAGGGGGGLGQECKEYEWQWVRVVWGAGRAGCLALCEPGGRFVGGEDCYTYTFAENKSGIAYQDRSCWGGGLLQPTTRSLGRVMVLF
jgi:hypothetical protein